MNTKFYSMASLATLICVLSVAALLNVQTLSKPVTSVNIQHLPQPITIPKINDTERQRLKVLLSSIRHLGNNRVAQHRNPDLRLFGYHPVSGIDGYVVKTLRNDPYKVTMSVVFSGGRYCVIDGKFYQEGDLIDDNTRVVKIEPMRVMVSRRGEERWYLVSNGIEGQLDGST